VQDARLAGAELSRESCRRDDRACPPRIGL